MKLRQDDLPQRHDGHDESVTNATDRLQESAEEAEVRLIGKTQQTERAP